MSREAVTDGEGRAHFAGLPAGRVSLEFRHPDLEFPEEVRMYRGGSESLKVQGMMLIPGEPTAKTFSLKTTEKMVN